MYKSINSMQTTKKMEVYIKQGYHISSVDGGQYHTFWVQKSSANPNPYELTLYKLPSTDEDNPSGYTVSIPIVMLGTPYVEAWKISYKYTVKGKLIYLIQYYGRAVIWSLISLFLKKRIQKEKLMRLASIMEEKDTLFHKWHPSTLISRYSNKNNKKESDLYDQMFFS